MTRITHFGVLITLLFATSACDDGGDKASNETEKETQQTETEAEGPDDEGAEQARADEESQQQGDEAIPAPPDVAEPPGEAERTESGLASKVLEQGDGDEHPTADSVVKVHYTGWTTDGEMFDSSRVRGEPATFPLNRVIAGWTEGLQLMVEGEKRRLWIPEKLAYKGAPGKPQGMLVFDVELLEIMPSDRGGR